VPTDARRQAADSNPGSTLRSDASLLVDGWSADGPRGTTTTPTWFGPGAAALAGWWHLPTDKQARAVAIVVSPVGRDHVVTTLSMRILAGQLAQARIATLRFDLQGTGDSAGSQYDPDIIEGWQNSIDTAVAEAREVAGTLPVMAVGLRMGALLLAIAANGDGPARDLEAVALWDPCLSGKAFLRESRALRRVALGEVREREGYVEGMGLELSDRDAGQLGRLTFPKSWDCSVRPLVLHRGEQPSRKLANAFDSPTAGARADWRSVEHQDALLEPEWIRPRAPIAASAGIAAWCADAAGEHLAPVRPKIRFVTTRRDSLGRSFTETLIPSLAPTAGVRLFGVLTEPASPNGQTAVFLNSSIESHIGPGRMWTELSRQWTERGVSSLRFDLSGIGESGVRAGQPPHVTYAPEALSDVMAAVRGVCGDDTSKVSLIGLCSGAYTAVEAGLHLRPAQVATLNLPARFVPPELMTGASTAARKGTSLPPRPLRVLVRLGWLRKLGHKLPNRFFQVLERLGVLASPWTPLSKLADVGVEVIAIAGDTDAAPFSVGRARELAALRRRGLIWRELPDVDHATIRKNAQRDVMAALSELIPAALPLPAGTMQPDLSGAAAAVQPEAR
jgi:alpha/beta superfamily hydrolase